jgi:hypothetical protein
MKSRIEENRIAYPVERTTFVPGWMSISPAIKSHSDHHNNLNQHLIRFDSFQEAEGCLTRILQCKIV